MERLLVSNHDDVLSLGVTAADVAWPVVLAMCIALMVLPFVFVLLAKSGADPDEPAA